MSEPVVITRDNGVLTATLDRPDKKNALTAQMYQILADAIDDANDDPAVRCVLIDAEGDMFTAGNDIAEFARHTAAPGQQGPATLDNPLLIALPRAKVPIVAAVQGRAVGIGVTLLLHCDIVVVARDALLSTPFVNLALVPEAASSLLLPARIGHVRAFAMFVLGEPITGETAAQIGLANIALPAGEVRAKARAYADLIAARPPASVAITKSLMRDAEALSSVIERENGHFAAQLRTPEAREAFQAFAERRAPNFGALDGASQGRR